MVWIPVKWNYNKAEDRETNRSDLESKHKQKCIRRSLEFTHSSPLALFIAMGELLAVAVECHKKNIGG